jgi:hypothetical protein
MIRDITNLIKEAVSKEFKELESRVSLYSISELLTTGREFVKDSSYPSAVIVFNELAKRNFKNNRISRVYNSLIETKFHYLNKEVVGKMVTSMLESMRLYQEEVISKEDLFTLEKLVDRFPFRTMDITLKTEFERLYCRFKEYCLKVFVGEK